MADRSEAIAKIRALRARASDAVSSEAEAEAAARIAAKIIAEHEITEAELIERGVAGITEGEHNRGRRTAHPALSICAFNIGQLCECRALSSRGSNIWVARDTADMVVITDAQEEVSAKDVQKMAEEVRERLLWIERMAHGITRS